MAGLSLPAAHMMAESPSCSHKIHIKKKKRDCFSTVHHYATKVFDFGILSIYENTLYRIALIFRGSKFLQIAALKEFVEKISQMRVTHAHDSTVAQILVE